MKETFITKIFVEKSRNVENLEIQLSETKRQHLILTGINGSGKTSLLVEIEKFLSNTFRDSFADFDTVISDLDFLKKQIALPNIIEEDIHKFENNISSYKKWLQSFGGTRIKFSGTKLSVNEKFQNGRFILAFFDSKRHTKLNIPQGISKIQLKKKYSLNEKANVNFIQYIVNLKADRSFARDDNEMTIVDKIDKWFNRLENRLKSIFDVEDLKLSFDRKNYNFDIEVKNGQTFNFNTLSDGYSAIISIITELLLRMEFHEGKSYDIEGIVIIDEIETHLHVDLQKKILPFLVDFFPKIQFIISTHSPFVLSSLSNATICDLESKTITNDLSGYSYDALIESYFNSDKYSDLLKLKIDEFEELVSLNERSNEHNERLRFLRNYFAHTPKYLSTELFVKLQQIELSELKNKK